MANFELSASPLPSKFFKFGQSKEQKIVSVKRKADSVRTSYYAMCKRTRHDTLDFKDFNFLVDPENGNCVVNGNEPLPETCEPECPTLNHFSNVDPPHYDLPENTIDVDVAFNGVTANGFYTGVDENFPIDQINITEEESQILEDNVPLTGAADELADPVDLDLDNLITDEVLQEMSMSAFGQINNGPANLRSEYGEDYNMFDSPELDCGNSFDNLQLSSLPDVSVWRAEEPDIRCGSLKDSLACEEGYLEELSNSLLNFTGDEELFLMDAVGKDGIDKSYYDGLSSLLLNSPIADCPDQIHEKDETELLLTSHADVRNPSVSCRAEVDNNARKAETDLLVAFDAHLRDPPVSCRAEVDDIAASQANGVQVVKLEFQMPTSASVKDPRFPELTNGVIVCTLNTEDPVVPSNDDVFLPFNEPPPTISYSPKSASRKSNKPVASSVNDYGYKASGRGKVLMQVEHNNSIGLGACASSQATGSRGLAEPVYGSKMKRKLSNGHESHTPSRSAVISSGGLGGNNNATNTNHGPLHANPKEKLLRVCSGKQLSNNMTKFSHDKPALGNGFRNHVQPNGSSLIQEQHAALPLEDYQLQHAETGSSDVMQSELVVNPQKLDEDQKLDEEEQYIESDDDVPYYSDVEAMVRHIMLTFGQQLNLPFPHLLRFYNLFTIPSYRYLIWTWIPTITIYMIMKKVLRGQEF